MKGLWLRLLGGLQVVDDDRPVNGFRSLKALALLGYLALEARPVSRAALSGLFWGELSDEKARTELRRVLHNLTQRLPGCLHVNRTAVSFNSESSLQVDVLRFFELVEVKQSSEALKLYQGSLMEGVFFGDCPEFENWLLARREQIRQSAAAEMDGLAAHYERNGEFDKALAMVQQLLTLENWHEDAHRRAMLLFARTGDIGAALRQYDTCRRVLADNFDITPSQPTVGLHSRLRQARNKGVHNLPVETSPFVGRQMILELLQNYFVAPDVHLISLVGLGGMGKTRLATVAARNAVKMKSRLFLEGVYWVPLGEVATAQDLPLAVARNLGLDVADPATAAEQLLLFGRDREMLLVLDNYEHLLPDTRLLSQLLRQCAALTIMVTSREPLNLQNETVILLDGLSYPQGDSNAIDGAAARKYPAVQLVEAKAQRLQPSFNLEEQTTCVVELCQLFEGMPLAIELAVGWLPTLPCADLVRALRRNFGLLTAAENDFPERHRNWEAIFQYSWDRLAADEKQLLANLAQFQNDLSHEAVLAIVDDALNSLRALISRALVRRSAASRYAMHELLRQYVLRQAAPFPDRLRETERQYVRYFTSYLTARETKLMAQGQAEALQEISAEAANIRTLWRLIIGKRDWAALEAVVRPVAYFFMIRGRFREGESWFDEASTALRAVPVRPAAFSHCLLWQCFFKTHIGLINDARQIHGQLLALTDCLKAPTDHAWLEIISAELQLLQNPDSPLPEITNYFHRALERLEGAKQTWIYAYTLMNLGRIASGDDAAQLLMKAQGLFQAAANNWGESLLLTARGDAIAGRVMAANSDSVAAAESEAHQLYVRAFAAASQINSKWAMGNILHKQALLAERARKIARAMDYFDQALQMIWESGDLWLATELLRDVVRTSLKCDRIERARFLAEQNLDLARVTGDPFAIAEQTHFLGHVLMAAGDFSGALRCYQKALPVFVAAEDGQAAWAIYGIGQAAFYEGDYPISRVYLTRSLIEFRRNGSPVGEATARGGLARLYQQLGDDVQAQQLYEENLPVWCALNDEVGIGLYLAGMAALRKPLPSAEWRITLLAAAQKLIDSGHGEPVAPAGRQQLAQQIDRAKQAVDVGAATRAWHLGREMAVADIITLAQSPVSQ